MDCKASELGELYERDEKRFNAILQKARFKTWILKCKAKIDNWQDQSRLRITVLSASVVDYGAECHRLVRNFGAEYCVKFSFP